MSPPRGSRPGPRGGPQTRFGQYIHEHRRANEAATPGPATQADSADAVGAAPTSDSPAAVAPTGPAQPMAVDIAETTLARLHAFVERARDHGGIEGMKTLGDVAERALELEVGRLLALLEVDEFPPLPEGRARLPRQAFGGALADTTPLHRFTFRPKRPEVVEQARRALWFLHQQAIPAERVEGIAVQAELLTVGIERLLETIKSQQ